MSIAELQEVLVKILINRTKMNKLLTYSKGLNLVNSMIKDSFLSY